MNAEGQEPVAVLVGPPGSGKSTVGVELAALLGKEFRDTDPDIEAEAGMPISDIFVEHGEAHFRTLERSVVGRALSEHPGVLALGGGAVLDADTRLALAERFVVFLDVGLASAAKRVGLDTSRPLLLGNVRGQLGKLMQERRPVYAEVASITVTTDDREPAEIAAEIARELVAAGR